MARIIGDLDELMTTVRHLAHSEAHQIKQEAEKKAERIRGDAQDRAHKEHERILDEARSRAEEIRRERQVKTTREEKRKYLETRRELLDEVWQEAQRRLRSLVDIEEDYAEALKRLVLSALQIIGPGRRMLAADPKGHKLLTQERLEAWSREAGEALGDSVVLERSSEPADTWGGVAVTEKEGRRRVDATFPVRLQLAKDEILGEVFQSLVRS